MLVKSIRLSIMFLIVSLSLFVTFLSCSQLPENERPNIIFIMTDDHGVGALSCYDSKINKTPNLDRIADEGIKFNSAFVSYPLCTPSRATNLTGTYAHKNDMIEIGPMFDFKHWTYPQALKESGYQTAVFGKWHLLSLPEYFDEYAILWEQGNYFNPDFIETGGILKKSEGYSTDLVTGKAIEWIKKQDDGEPFLLLCHYKNPHYPWEPDSAHWEQFKDREFDYPPTFDEDISKRVPPQSLFIPLNGVEKWEGVKDYWEQFMPSGLNAEAQKKWNYQFFMRSYLACIASVDDNVGRLLDYLDSAGLAENTIVVYTSDNGMLQGEHGLIDKKLFLEESIRVPLIVRYPKEVKPGSVSDAIVGNHQFAATFADYASAPVPDSIQGRSFRPLLKGDRPADWPQDFYYQFMVSDNWNHYGIRTDRYKLAYYNGTDKWEFFDLQKDSLELVNAYDEPGYQEIIVQMKKRLDEMRRDLEISEEIEAEIFNQRNPESFKTMRAHLKKKIIQNTQQSGSEAVFND